MPILQISQQTFPLKKYTSQTLYEIFRSPNSFLLESGKQDNYSFIGADPFLIFKSQKNNFWIKKRGNKNSNKKLTSNPFIALKKIIKKYESSRTLKMPLFYGGAAGFISYEFSRFFDQTPQLKNTSRNSNFIFNLPESIFLFCDHAIAINHSQKKFTIFGLGKTLTSAQKKVEAWKKKIYSSSQLIRHHPDQSLLHQKINSNFTRTEYISAIKKVKNYLRSGDTFQANISQKFSTKTELDAFTLYQKLSKINPAPFAAYFEFSDFQIISSSPERLFRVERGKILTQPIAGTRPRGENFSNDKNLQNKLKTSPKELAEHIMLVDLERNDLGRICKFGSVQVKKFGTIEKYSHVQHLVSEIIGKLDPKKNAFDVLAALFPGGTITGCPKIRTMEIIAELEKIPREIYTGSIGYFNFSDEADFNIAIRTFVKKDRQLNFSAGGGIVMDSVPEKEYDETLFKVQALLESLKEN